MATKIETSFPEASKIFFPLKGSSNPDVEEFQNIVSKNVVEDVNSGENVESENTKTPEDDIETSYVTPTLASLYESQEVYDKALYYFQILNEDGQYDEKIADLNYLISYFEERERYEDCAHLLKIKDKIIANEEFKTK